MQESHDMGRDSSSTSKLVMAPSHISDLMVSSDICPSCQWVSVAVSALFTVCVDASRCAVPSTLYRLSHLKILPTTTLFQLWMVHILSLKRTEYPESLTSPMQISVSAMS